MATRKEIQKEIHEVVSSILLLRKLPTVTDSQLAELLQNLQELADQLKRS